jgi:hypothetical protein
MNNTNTKKNGNPLSFVFGKLFTRLTQSPEVYPIKYYIRKKRSRREVNMYSLR